MSAMVEHESHLWPYNPMSNLLGDEISLWAAIYTSSYSPLPYFASIHFSFLLELKSSYE